MASVGVDVGLTDPRSWFRLGQRAVRLAVWAPEPLTQIVVNIVIIAALMLVSAVGFVVGIPLALASLFFLFLGVARLIVQQARRIA